MSGSNPRLGRGLAALLGEAVAAPGAPNRTVLPVTALTPGPFQPRVSFDEAALADLTASIRQQGVLQPLLARPTPGAQQGSYQIIAGERRWRAAQAAGLHEVPVLIRPLNDTEAMAASLVENLQRQDLDAMEEAEGYRRLQTEFGITQDQLGQLVGKSRSHVANTIRLLTLPTPVQEHLRSGALTAGHARALLPHPDPSAAARIVLARGLNVRQTEALLSRANPPPRAAPDAEIAALERQLTSALGLTVRIKASGQGGQVQLSFRSLEQLDGLIERLTRIDNRH